MSSIQIHFGTKNPTLDELEKINLKIASYKGNLESWLLGHRILHRWIRNLEIRRAKLLDPLIQIYKDQQSSALPANFPHSRVTPLQIFKFLKEKTSYTIWRKTIERIGFDNTIVNLIFYALKNPKTNAGRSILDFCNQLPKIRRVLTKKGEFDINSYRVPPEKHVIEVLLLTTLSALKKPIPEDVSVISKMIKEFHQQLNRMNTQDLNEARYKWYTHKQSKKTKLKKLRLPAHLTIFEQRVLKTLFCSYWESLRALSFRLTVPGYKPAFKKKEILKAYYFLKEMGYPIPEELEGRYQASIKAG